MAHWMNYTDGVFDIKKQAASTANLVVDLLMYAKIVSDKGSDRACEVAAAIFLAFRTNPALSSDAEDETYVQRILESI